jgi:heat shock protein HslJ
MLLFYGSLTAQDPLVESNWTVTYVRGANIGKVEAYLNFDASGERFTGNTGCNIMNGTVRVQTDRVTFSAIITTKRACMRQTAPVESSVLTALQTATRYKRSSDRLMLYAGNRLVLELKPRSVTNDDDQPQNPTDSLNLADRKWILQAIAGTAIPKVEQEAFINFDAEKGTAGGDTSCNVFGGSYTVNANKISITDTISTMRACVEDERMNIERGFLDALQDADRYEIRANKLFIYSRGKLLLTFEGLKK